MADNIDITPGTGKTVAADDIGSVWHQRVKLSVGADGAASDAVPAVAALDSTGTGIQAVGMVAQFDDVSTSTVTENQFAHPRLSARRALLVEGVQAHDAVNATNPFLNGAEAIAHGANPTAVAAADITKLYANRAGIPFVIGGHPNVVTRSDQLSSATSNAALVTVSAGTIIVVTSIQVVLGSDVSTTPSVIIGFGTANTPAISNAGIVLAHPAIAGGGGCGRGDGSGILAVGADNEDLRYTTGTITGGNMWVTYSYYTIAS